MGFILSRLPAAEARVRAFAAETRGYYSQRVDCGECARGWIALYFGADCSGIEAPEPADPGLARFEAINREVFAAFAVKGEFELAYETRVMFGQPTTG